MSYSRFIFGKELNDLSYSDIEKYFEQERNESTTLEFKSFKKGNSKFDEGLRGIIRSICALLNSEEGIIIWGAPEGITPQGQKDKIFKGSLTPIPEYKHKDWFVTKICDSITPSPSNFKVECLEVNNEFVYIFEVEQSRYKPHQFNNTYYARWDGQSRPAPHYLIEALFKQITFPKLGGYLNFNEVILTNGGLYALKLDLIIINWSEFNNEENVFFKLTASYGKFHEEYRLAAIQNTAEIPHAGDHFSNIIFRN